MALSDQDVRLSRHARDRIKDEARRAGRAARRKEAQALKAAASLLDADPASLTAAQRRARRVEIFGGKQ